MTTSTLPKNTLVSLPDFRVVPGETATVSVYDRSFQFGDSLYEVTRTFDGVPFALDEHLRRLKDSAELALFEVPLELERIREQTVQACRAYFRKYGNKDVYIRIVVSRGEGDLNIDRATSSDPASYIFIKEFKPWSDSLYTKGAHYAVVGRRRNHPDALPPALKSGNYLNNILALAEAKKLGADDAIMANYQGFITEGTTNNIYAVFKDEVWTPPLSIGILAGITREFVFDLCRQKAIKIQDRLFTATDLTQASEMFLTSATKEVMPITKLNGGPVGTGAPGRVTETIRKGFEEFRNQYVRSRKHESLFV